MRLERELFGYDILITVQFNTVVISEINLHPIHQVAVSSKTMPYSKGYKIIATEDFEARMIQIHDEVMKFAKKYHNRKLTKEEQFLSDLGYK